MKKITLDAARAFMNAEKFKRDNTEVEVLPNVTVLKLFGNQIAYRFNDPQRTLTITNAGWDTNTTKERLNAIPGVHINQKNWQWYLNDELWDGKLIDINNKAI